MERERGLLLQRVGADDPPNLVVFQEPEAISLTSILVQHRLHLLQQRGRLHLIFAKSLQVLASDVGMRTLKQFSEGCVAQICRISRRSHQFAELELDDRVDLLFTEHLHYFIYLDRKEH